MAIDARAFVEPAVAKAGIDARHNVVLRAIGEKVRQVEAEGRVAIVVAADEAAIDEDRTSRNAPSNSTEMRRPASLGGNLELAAIPAHAALGIAPAERLVAVRVQLFIAHERQLHRPVVGQIERAPLRVVELGLGKCRSRRSWRSRPARSRSRGPSPDRRRCRTGTSSRNRKAVVSRGAMAASASAVRASGAWASIAAARAQAERATSEEAERAAPEEKQITTGDARHRSPLSQWCCAGSVLRAQRKQTRTINQPGANSKRFHIASCSSRPAIRKQAFAL